MFKQRCLCLENEKTAISLIHIRKQVCSCLSLSTVSLMIHSVLMLSVLFYCHCALQKLPPPPTHTISFTHLPHTDTHTNTHTFPFFLCHVALPVLILLIGLLCLCVLPWWRCYFDGELSSIELTQIGPTDALHHHAWLTSPARHFSPKWQTRLSSPAPPAPLSPLFSFFLPYERANFDVCEINGRDDSYIC